MSGSRRSGRADRGHGSRKRAGGKRKGKAPKPKRRAPVSMADPSDTEDADVRYVQPYQATKAYLCPGCNRDIAVGTGHMVVVPPDAPDLRRHWHRGCWVNRRNRR